LIKLKASDALKKVIDINRIKLDIVEWVERANQSEEIKHGDETDKSD
jgi:hypothetical protein